MILILVIRKSEQAKTIAVLKMLLRTEQGLSLSDSQRVHFPVPFHLYARLLVCSWGLYERTWLGVMRIEET